MMVTCGNRHPQIEDLFLGLPHCKIKSCKATVSQICLGV